jgi:hypothetical protein
LLTPFAGHQSQDVKVLARDAFDETRMGVTGDLQRAVVRRFDAARYGGRRVDTGEFLAQHRLDVRVWSWICLDVLAHEDTSAPGMSLIVLSHAHAEAAFLSLRTHPNTVCNEVTTLRMRMGPIQAEEGPQATP